MEGVRTLATPTDLTATDWPEKYRPTKLEQMIGQERAVETVAAILRLGLRRPILFAGPVGDGKTTLARITASAILCEGSNKPCGLCMVCQQIRRGGFGQAADFSSYQEIEGGWLEAEDIEELIAAPFRGGFDSNDILMIDEIQELSPKLQGMLLKPLEMSASKSSRRFILCTSEPTAISKALRSRCDVISLKHVSAPETKRHLRSIADFEGMKIRDESLAEILLWSGGHLRDAIAKLQDVHRRFPLQEISPSDVFGGDASKHQRAAFIVVSLVLGKDYRKHISQLDEVVTPAEIPQLILEALSNAIRIREGRIQQTDHLPEAYRRLFENLPERDLYMFAGALATVEFSGLVDQRNIELFLASVSYRHKNGHFPFELRPSQ